MSKVWKHSQFVKFFKSSPRKAFEYRRDCLGDEIPSEYLTEEEKKAVKPTKIAPVVTETPKEEVTPVEVKEEAPEMVGVDDLTLEDMKTILDGADIKYSHLAKEKGLMRLIKENNLI